MSELIAKTYKLPVNLYETLRNRAFEERTTMTQVVIRALQKELDIPQEATDE